MTRIIKSIDDLSFEEEKERNRPLLSYEYSAKIYKETGLYEFEDFDFYGTEMLKERARFFQKYKRYTDIDKRKNPRAYKLFWDREEHRRINGVTLPIKSPPGGGLSDKDLLDIWIPGEMYGMVNYGPILRTEDDEDVKLDSDKTKAKENRSELDLLFAELGGDLVKEKEYDFPDFWDGHFQFWVAKSFAARIGLDICVGKARRKGFSYVMGWDAFNRYDLKPALTTVLVAFDMKYLTQANATMSMVKKYADFINQHTDWTKSRLTNSTSHIRAGYNIRGKTGDFGFLSQVISVSAGPDNADCVIGKDATKVIYEECGKFPNLLDVVGTTQSTTESGDYTTGQSIYFGTAGSKDGNYDDFRKIFYDPNAYGCLAINNIWDENRRGTGCGFFFPQQQNMEPYIDIHGNSQTDEALRVFKEKLEFKRVSTTDTEDFSQWVAQRATSPKVAFSRNASNIFNAVAIQDQIHRIEHDPNLRNIGREGILKMSEVKGKSTVTLMTNEELRIKGLPYHPPIREIDMKPNDDFHGCIVEYFSPYRTPVPSDDGTSVRHVVPSGLYYIWHDPYATDKDTKKITQRDSLGAAFVYMRSNPYTQSKGDRLVATWIGRPSSTITYNEQLRLLCMYYNAKMLFENDRGDVIPHFRHKKSLQFLEEEPELASLRDHAGKKTGRNYGMHINPKRKADGARMLRDQLDTVISGKQGDGERKTFIQYIYCLRTLYELLRWNKDGNFDCVSALIVGMYHLREIEDLNAREDEQRTEQEDDDFFERDLF